MNSSSTRIERRLIEDPSWLPFLAHGLRLLRQPSNGDLLHVLDRLRDLFERLSSSVAHVLASSRVQLLKLDPRRLFHKTVIGHLLETAFFKLGGLGQSNVAFGHHSMVRSIGSSHAIQALLQSEVIVIVRSSRALSFLHVGLLVRQVPESRDGFVEVVVVLLLLVAIPLFRLGRHELARCLVSSRLSHHGPLLLAGGLRMSQQVRFHLQSDA